MEIEEMEFSDVDIDEDAYYESWRDDAGCRLDDSVKNLIDEFLCELGGYYEGKDDRLFQHIVQHMGHVLNKDVTLTIKPIGEGYGRKLLVEY